MHLPPDMETYRGIPALNDPDMSPCRGRGAVGRGGVGARFDHNAEGYSVVVRQAGSVPGAA
jgi:hypothetical protein